MAPVNDEVRLRPLRADEYDAFFRAATDGYAEGIEIHGDTSAVAAREKAVADMAQALPDGLATPGHAIFAIEKGGARVGQLWIAEREVHGRRVLFIYDVEIDAAYRGTGLGRAAMLLAEEEARARGLDRIELNVFGGNAVARGLYRSLGYGERAVLMAKNLA
jgi:ribosomal protein S18 acetylase RimI-like enzyme